MKVIVLALLAANILFFAWRVAKPLPAPRAPTEITHPEHVNRLLMLRELKGDELRNRSLEERGVGSAAVAVDAICFRFGPLDTPEIITEVKLWLEDHKATTHLKRGERRELALYWLFLPPAPDRDTAVQKVLTMRDAGIEDISVIARGDMANAISLGVYSRRTSLDRRLAELKKHGHSPSVSPRYRTKKAAWVEAVFAKDVEFSGDEFQEAFPDIKVEDAPCVGQKTAEAGSADAQETTADDAARKNSAEQTTEKPGSSERSKPSGKSGSARSEPEEKRNGTDPDPFPGT